MSSIKAVRVLTIATACALTGSIPGPAAAQCVPGAQPAAAATTAPATDDSPEQAPLTTVPPSPGPLVINWNFKNGAGHANLTCTPDGTCLFSGHLDGRRPGKDLDVAMGVKSSNGAAIVLHYVGDASNAQWTKQVHSDVLKDEWASFTKDRKWTFSVHIWETAQGRKAAYEARERKRAELTRFVDDAIKRHDEAAAKAKQADLQKEQQQQAAQAQAQASQSQSSGGGSSAGQVLSTLGTVMGTALSFL